jgi:AraC-like DNA-binding protein
LAYLLLICVIAIMNFSLTDILIIIVIFQLLFISFFLFSQEKGNKTSLFLLGAFFLSFCLNLIDGFLLLQRVYFDYPNFALWASFMPLLYGPLLYLYIRSVLFNDMVVHRKTYFHFAPFILLTLLSIISYSLQPADEKLKMLHAVIDRKIPTYIYWVAAVLYLHFFLYMFLCWRLIHQYQLAASNKFSDEQRTNLSWLRSTVFFFIIFMVLGAINGIMGFTRGAKYYYLFLTVLIAIFFLFINRVMLKALRIPGIFSMMSEQETKEEQPGMPKYSGSGLQEAEKKKIEDHLLQLMQKEKPYLEPELSLNQLAAQLSVKPKILSQVINEKLGHNFFDFINTYRIEEAKRLLSGSEDPKITVLEVLYEVGFNSKSSFNTLFKKNTGLTPSDFKKKHRIQKRSDSGKL